MAPDASAPPDVVFRGATPADAGALADLTTQLGYPASAADITRRLAMLGDGDGLVLVAELNGQAVGWVHVRVVALLTGSHAEIDGLVVDEALRGHRIGEALMARAEEWAAERGETRVYVRSNVIRERAHQFYERLGYGRVKTSFTFVKELVATRDRAD